MSKRNAKLRPMVLTDPAEIAFLRSVRAMTPKGRRRLLAAMKAMVENRPAQLARALQVRWLHTIGHPDPEGGANAIMRAGIRSALCPAGAEAEA